MPEVVHAAIALPPLPYAPAALEPFMSRETLQYHYGKHHKKYVDTTNELLKGTELEGQPLEDVLAQASGVLLDNAAQAWNHGFFWHCLTPRQESPPAALTRRIGEAFGSFENFQAKFDRIATSLFGSGWAWLVEDAEGALRIVATRNAGMPATNQVALLTCDLWEHAYYLDHRNDRAKYLKAFWQLVNWEFVAGNLEQGWEFPSAAPGSGSAADPVDEASMESFPASDPPAHSPTRAGPPDRRKDG